MKLFTHSFIFPPILNLIHLLLLGVRYLFNISFYTGQNVLFQNVMAVCTHDAMLIPSDLLLYSIRFSTIHPLFFVHRVCLSPFLCGVAHYLVNGFLEVLSTLFTLSSVHAIIRAP